MILAEQSRADKLYRQNLKPMLEATHDLSFAAAEELPADDLKRIALRNDDRLIRPLRSEVVA